MKNNTLTKQDMIKQMSKDSGVCQEDMYNAVQSMFNFIINGLCEGKRLEFRNFGTFFTRVTKKRITSGMNTADGGPIEIPAHAMVKFKPGKKLRTIVKEAIEIHNDDE